MTGGNVGRGRPLFANAGCGGCHQLSEVPEARAVIAGRLANNPDNLTRWIADP